MHSVTNNPLLCLCISCLQLTYDPLAPAFGCPFPSPVLSSVSAASSSSSSAAHSFTFHPPSGFHLVGSYPLQTGLRGHINIDLCLEMPSECLKPKDYWDYRYLAKRSRWLQHIGETLSRTGEFEIHLGRMRGAIEKPVLHLTPLKLNDEDGTWKPYTGILSKVIIRIFPCPPEGFFSTRRMHPSKSNLHRPMKGKDGATSKGNKSNIKQDSSDDSSAAGPPTPYYNALLLEDMFYRTHLAQMFQMVQDSPAVKETILLLKLWTKQRKLDQARSGEGDGWGMEELKWTSEGVTGTSSKKVEKKGKKASSSAASDSSHLTLASTSSYQLPSDLVTSGPCGGFNGFFWTMFLRHLFETKVLYKSMSTYQMFKQTLLQIVKMNMLVNQDRKDGGIYIGFDPTKMNSLASLTLLTNPLAQKEQPLEEKELASWRSTESVELLFLAANGSTPESGVINLLARTPRDAYLQLKQEAYLSLTTLDDHASLLGTMFGTGVGTGESNSSSSSSTTPFDSHRSLLEHLLSTSKPLPSSSQLGTDTFETLFIQTWKREDKFDAIIRLDLGHPESSEGPWSSETSKTTPSIEPSRFQDMDHVSSVLTKIRLILTQGLGDRIILLSMRPYVSSTKGTLRVDIGLLLHPQHGSRILDIGPSAEDEDASKCFRNFWGDLSSLRRFKDGSIVEAVIWSQPGLNGIVHTSPQLIPFQIVTYVLKRHLHLQEDSFEFIVNPFDSLLKLRTIVSQPTLPGRWEESLVLSNPNIDPILTGSNSLFVTFKNLSNTIKSCEDLPLTIIGLKMLGEYSRYTSIFPLQPIDIMKLRPDHTEHTLDVVPILLQFESSGKWPEDSLAISRIKSAFYIQVGTALQKKDIQTLVSLDSIDIFYHGFVFRLRIFYEQELSIRLMEEKMGQFELGSSMIPVPTSSEIRKNFIFQPALSQSLKFVQETYPLFGPTCRLVKRWLHAHMFSGYFSSDLIDLTVAALFTNPKPYTIPGSSLQGLKRWLTWFGEKDHTSNPVIVDLGGDLTSETIDKMQATFGLRRSSGNGGPLLYVASVHDKDCTLIHSSDSNGKELNLDRFILERAISYARSSLTTLTTLFSSNDITTSNQWKSIFKTPTSIPNAFDAIIHLKTNMLPIQHLTQAIAPPKTLLQSAEVVASSSKDNKKGYKLPPDAFTSAIQFSNDGPSSSRTVPLVGFDPVQAYLTNLRQIFGQRAYFFHDSCGGTMIGIKWRSEFRNNLEKENKFSVKATQSSMPVFDKKTGQIMGLKVNLNEIYADIKRAGTGLVERIQLE